MEEKKKNESIADVPSIYEEPKIDEEEEEEEGIMNVFSKLLRDKLKTGKKKLAEVG
jgi:hypothetical protein